MVGDDDVKLDPTLEDLLEKAAKQYQVPLRNF